MTSTQNVFIFKMYTDEKGSEEVSIGHPVSKIELESQDVIISEGNLKGNSKPSNSATSNKSRFSNKQTESRRNEFDSSKSLNAPPLNARSVVVRNISSKFEGASLSNQSENINNARDIGKYINTLKDEDNSRQSSLIQNKIKVFQTKIEKGAENKDETIRKNNAKIDLFKKEFGEKMKYKDPLLIRNTKLTSNKDEVSILNKEKDLILNSESDSFLNGGKSKVSLSDGPSKKELVRPPLEEYKKIYELTNMKGDGRDWIKKDGLQFVSIAEAKKELIGIPDVKIPPKNREYSRKLLPAHSSYAENSFQKSKLVDSKHSNALETNTSSRTQATPKSRVFNDLPVINIISKNSLSDEETELLPHSKVERYQSNSKNISSEKTSVQSLINEYNTIQTENPTNQSSWRKRPKNTITNSNGNHGSSVNGLEENKDYDSLPFENSNFRNYRQEDSPKSKSFNMNIEIIPVKTLSTDFGSNHRNLTKSITVTKPLKLKSEYFVSANSINYRTENGIASNRPEFATPNKINKFKPTYKNSNSVLDDTSRIKSSIPQKTIGSSPGATIPIPPTPPPSLQNGYVSLPALLENTRVEPKQKNVSKKNSNSPSSAELKSTLKRELEKKFKTIISEEDKGMEEISTIPVSDSTITPYDLSPPSKPRSTSIRSSLAAGKENYEISFDYKLKDYETKDKLITKMTKPETKENSERVSQFTASLRKLKQDNALDKMFPRANGPMKGKKFEPPSQEKSEHNSQSDSTSFAYHIGEKANKEREFDEGWVSVGEAINESKSSKDRKADKKVEPPVDYDVTFGESNDSIEKNKRFIQNRDGHSTAPPQNGSERSSSEVDSRTKSNGFNNQSGMANGDMKDERINGKTDEMSKNNKLVQNEPNPDYD